MDLFERGGVALDISTAIGAWHYATVLTRIAHKHSKLLQEKFNTLQCFHDVKQFKEAVTKLETWSMHYQQAPGRKQRNAERRAEREMAAASAKANDSTE